MFSPLNSLVYRCITLYSDFVRLALYFKKISLSAFCRRARCSVMSPPAVLKSRSEQPKRTEHYPAEISGTWYHFGRNRIRKMAGYLSNRNWISGTCLFFVAAFNMCWYCVTDMEMLRGFTGLSLYQIVTSRTPSFPSGKRQSCCRGCLCQLHTGWNKSWKISNRLLTISSTKKMLKWYGHYIFKLYLLINGCFFSCTGWAVFIPVFCH